MEKKTGRMSLPGLNRRVDAHDSLGYGSGYWSGLLMMMVVKFTYQLGKKFPREDLHPAGIGHLRGRPGPRQSLCVTACKQSPSGLHTRP
jgi:hypothetical protein